MKKVKIVRTFGNEKQTLGVLTTDNFTCKTLELPDKKNASRVSCIPVGKYICKYTKSPLFSKNAGKDVFTYAILSVPNRAGIRIHSANYARQLLGCIALGSEHKDLDMDMQLDAAQVLNEYTITESGDYIMQLELYGQHDNSGAGIGYFYTEVTKNGSPIANDNNTHQNSVARNTKCTYTHTAKISAVIGDAIGFNVYKTMVTQDNGSITLIKTA